jgi:hypothetical protein
MRTAAGSEACIGTASTAFHEELFPAARTGTSPPAGHNFLGCSRERLSFRGSAIVDAIVFQALIGAGNDETQLVLSAGGCTRRAFDTERTLDYGRQS